jgi:tetratricopeptide (TPR) repeat protein
MRGLAIIMAVLLLAVSSWAQAQDAPPVTGEPEQISIEPGDIELAAEDIEAAVARFTERAAEFQGDIGRTVEGQFKNREKQVDARFESQLQKQEALEMLAIEDAIKQFEAFVERFPNEERYTPDALFRLADLHYVKAKRQFEIVRLDKIREYEKQLELFDEGLLRTEPEPPHADFSRSIVLYDRISQQFPNYRYIDAVYYLMAYCYQEQGNLPKVRAAFEDLIASRPDSSYIAEAYLRIGDAHFNEQNYEPALAALEKASQFKDSFFYDQILYKLASTYFILNRFEESVATFAKVNDYSEVMKKKEGRDSYFRDEAIKYIAFCYAQGTDYWANAGEANAEAFFDRYGDVPWEADVFRDLGDYFYQQSDWSQAVASYKRVLAKDPWDPDNPELQMRIIAIYWRGLKDEQQVNTERERLIVDYGEDSQWAMNNADNPEAVREASQLALDSLKQWATFQHVQAFRYRQNGEEQEAVAYYGRAAQAYRKFLEKFPHDKEAYELTFRLAETLFYSGDFTEAVNVYLKVRDSKLNDVHFQESAYQVVYCYWNIILAAEGQLTQTEEQVAEQQKEREKLKGQATELELPELKQKYIEASDFYVAKVPDPKDKELIAWNSAEIFYQYNHLESARERYIGIVDNFPKSEFAPRAAQRIIDTYTIVEDWVKVAEWSERLAALDIGSGEQRAEMRARLMFIKGNAMARFAADLEARQEWEKAAEQYLAAVAQDRKNIDAPKMLFNAAVDYRNAGRPAKAMELFERVVTEYPEAEFASEALYFVAENAYDSFNLDKASTSYARLYTKYPNIDPQRKCSAVYNHAQLEEFNHNYREAARIYESYVDTCEAVDPNAPVILFRAGEIYEKQEDWRNMNRLYSAFVDRYGSQPAYYRFVVQAYYKIGQAYMRRGSMRDAVTYFEKALAFFAGKPVLKDDFIANQMAAEARFTLVDMEFDKYRNLKIGGRTQAKLAESFQAKEKAMYDMIKLYVSVKDFRSPEYFLAASYRSALVVEMYADALFDAPMPKIAGLTQEEEEEFQAQYEQKMYELATPFYKQAAQVYLQALEDGRKAKLFGSPWMKRIFQALNRPNILPHVVGSVTMRKPELPRFESTVTSPLPFDTGLPHERIKPVEEAPKPEDAQPAQGQPASAATP